LKDPLLYRNAFITFNFVDSASFLVFFTLLSWFTSRSRCFSTRIFITFRLSGLCTFKTSSLVYIADINTICFSLLLPQWSFLSPLPFGLSLLDALSLDGSHFFEHKRVVAFEKTIEPNLFMLVQKNWRAENGENCNVFYESNFLTMFYLQFKIHKLLCSVSKNILRLLEYLSFVFYMISKLSIPSAHIPGSKITK